MVHQSCKECNRTFIADSAEEAEAVYKQQAKEGNTEAASFEDAVDTGEVGYAKYCPYCGSTAIEAT